MWCATRRPPCRTLAKASCVRTVFIVRPSCIAWSCVIACFSVASGVITNPSGLTMRPATSGPDAQPSWTMRISCKADGAIRARSPNPPCTQQEVLPGTKVLVSMSNAKTGLQHPTFATMSGGGAKPFAPSCGAPTDAALSKSATFGTLAARSRYRNVGVFYADTGITCHSMATAPQFMCPSRLLP